MEKLVEIPSSEWLKVYNNLPISGKLPNARIQDNLFASLQWTGKTAFEKTNRQYWALEVNNQAVSFLSSYAISENVIRLRGLCTLPGFQNQGFMKKLISSVTKKFPGNTFICFVSESGIPVCKSTGFEFVSNFTPRYVEFKDNWGRGWQEDRSSLIYLMKLNT